MAAMPPDKMRLFLDEDLRQRAHEAVELFLKDHSSVRGNQIRPMPMVLQAAGFKGFVNLVEKQKERNTNSANKAFWEFMHGLMVQTDGPDHSLRRFIENIPEIANAMENPHTAADRRERRRINRDNKALIDAFLEQVLPVYLEHFNCHYFYRIKQGGQGVEL